MVPRGEQGTREGNGDGGGDGGGDGNEDGNGYEDRDGAGTVTGTVMRIERGVEGRESLRTYEVLLEAGQKTRERGGNANY